MMNINELSVEDLAKLQEQQLIAKKAEEILDGAINSISLPLKSYKNGIFIIWSDSHNRIYITQDGDEFAYNCDFLHEQYRVRLNKQAIYAGIKSGYRGVEHLASTAGVNYNRNRLINSGSN